MAYARSDLDFLLARYIYSVRAMLSRAARRIGGQMSDADYTATLASIASANSAMDSLALS